jgi:hypothetical protein
MAIGCGDDSDTWIADQDRADGGASSASADDSSRESDEPGEDEDPDDVDRNDDDGDNAASAGDDRDATIGNGVDGGGEDQVEAVHDGGRGEDREGIEDETDRNDGDDATSADDGHDDEVDEHDPADAGADPETRDPPDASLTEDDLISDDSDSNADTDSDDAHGADDVSTPPPRVENPSTAPAPGVQGDVYNREAVVPPMCYTQTTGFFNPCYVCHQDEVRGTGRANFQNDGFLQGDYFFSDVATHNHWTNLFIDRTARMAEISDEQIDEWVATDNYNGTSERLAEQGYEGYFPFIADLEKGAMAFDGEGFALDGSHWVAFTYKPMPSTFWPTNGATDDVMIKLPAEFRQKADGSYSRDVYVANLAIAEAAIKGMSSVTLPEVDENEIGVDLDGDEALGLITELLRPPNYVGQASGVNVEIFLYPAGTSFLHTVRYVGIDEQGSIVIPPRMKEVRYMIKQEFKRKDIIAKVYSDEYQEKQQGALPRYFSQGDDGITNKFGWLINGFIENADGQLRHQSFEEGFFCMGCHNSIGTTIDSTFAFPRKVDGADGWGYIDLHGMPDAPSVGEQTGEIRTYLERVGGGSEFRHNDEMRERFFDGTQLDHAKLDQAADVYEMVTPSPERARLLNKAYRVLVEEQDLPERGFNHGRDPTAVFPVNVFDDVDPETVPVLPPERQFKYDIRLNWSGE